MTPPFYRLWPLNCGECTLGENHLLGDAYSDEDRVPFTLYAFLADGGPGRRVLIDLGPIGLDYVNAMFRRYAFFRDLPGDPDAITQPAGSVFDWLPRFGLGPDDIDALVFTHLHADHHGMVDATDAGAVLRLPHARVFASAVGWQYNLDQRVDGRWNSYIDHAFADWLLEGSRTGRVQFLDNASVQAGLDMIHLGGHAVCSQAVRVRTADGPAIICSDEVYRYDLLERAVIARLHTTPERYTAALNRLVDLALAGAILLPCHDPALSEAYRRHGDAWLSHVKPLSDKAARGFRSVLGRAVS